MVIDKAKELLDSSLISPYSPKEGTLGEPMADFAVDKKHTIVFVVESGSVKAATGWRENDMSRDVISASVLTEGDAVAFLPGERFIVSGDGKTLKYVLG